MIKELEKRLEIENNLLDIVYHRDDFTTSDLQGAIEAQVSIAMQAGAKLYKEEVERLLEKTN
jgi:hypothetical protein